jgi:hypothetical protein
MLARLADEQPGHDDRGRTASGSVAQSAGLLGPRITRPHANAGHIPSPPARSHDCFDLQCRRTARDRIGDKVIASAIEVWQALGRELDPPPDRRTHDLYVARSGLITGRSQVRILPPIRPRGPVNGGLLLARIEAALNFLSTALNFLSRFPVELDIRLCIAPAVGSGEQGSSGFRDGWIRKRSGMSADERPLAQPARSSTSRTTAATPSSPL